MTYTEEQHQLMLNYQQTEITAYHLYTYLAKKEKNPANKKIITRIANDELKHAEIWKKYTKETVDPKKLSILWFKFLYLIFGFTFTIRLSEKNEDSGIVMYEKLADVIPDISKIIEEEERHEEELINLLDEERLQYVGSMVLGLNDALVEITGTIAGLTFAMANNRLVAMSAIVTGIAATLSMAASNYLAEKADGHHNPFKSSLFTGATYLIAVILLVLPYLLLPPDMYIAAFVTMLVIVIALIAFFNYYIAIAKEQSFKKPFLQMLIISFSVMIISYIIGILAKKWLGVDVG
ncbi:VIT1/CCC1 transporter family protein [Vagococcus humatus]|uniref:Rubrerythrin family protein n=1 Tax=Vagococcus humatus TaxID=1889241 RepID=A0A429Z5Q4_9ENTE|nr:VIT1/CCC1 family protein [Vagococcus humatus]RST89013.1 rubrerythrin family protein [Vagococcus humatus]